MSDATTLHPPLPAARRRNGPPYPGFRPFRRDEWPIFFGRDRQVKALLKLLADHHFICMHGPSGSGKSSLIEAGLIATLERGHRRLGTDWFTGTFRPGAAPLLNLARGLLDALGDKVERTEASVVEMHSRLVRPGGSIARAVRESGLPRGGNLLLVADQFEELFRFRALGDPQEAVRFVDLLLDVFDEQPDGVHVAIATRTDFLGDFSDIVGLAEAANAAPYLTPALTEDELRAAIRGPAELHGGSIDPQLVEALLKDSADEPDRLPILQHALMRCWDVADRLGTPGRLTFDVYRSDAIRSVRDALNSHADEVMQSPELKGLERDVELTFRALTDLDGQRRAIRRPLPWSQLLAETGSPPPGEAKDGHAEPLPMERVVNRFRAEGTGFLGRPRPEEKELKPDTVVDIAHEALIRRWRRMNRRAEPGRGRPRDGWLWDQVEDGHLYRALLIGARTSDEVISADSLKSRLAWWQRQPRTPAWARRLSDNRDATEQDARNDLAGIEALFERSAMARKRKRWFSLLTLLGMIAIVAVPIYIVVKEAEREEERRLEAIQREKERSALREEDLINRGRAAAERDAAQRQLADTQEALSRTKAELEEANRRLASTSPTSGTAPVMVDTPTSGDRVAQIALKARPEQQTATTGAPSCEGALWIGSGNAANLEVVDGTSRRPARLDEVRADRRFVLAKNLYLRKELPRREGYIQQESIGIAPKGAQIVALDDPERFDRPSGPQYWLKARVDGQVCSLVYFQFAKGSEPEARKLARALEADGYLVPGQEALSSAVGLAEVRYYYDSDRAAAVQLAKDATSDARELGLARNRTIRVQDFSKWKGNKPPPGTLELWLDLSDR